jgi:beta-lactamase regulating signal transducer with metallopeptidase domain
MDITTAHDLWTLLAQSFIFSVLLAIAVRVALEFLTPANASTRFAVWFATLLVIAIFPLAALLPSSSPSRRIETAPAMPPPVVSAAPRSSLAIPEAAPSLLAPSPGNPQPAQEYPMQTQVFLPQDAAEALFVLYTLIVVMLFARLGVSYVRLRRLKKRAFPAPPEVRARFETWRARCKTLRPVKLMLTGSARSPMAVGFSAPAVIIPEALLLRLTGEELDHLGLHELAHLRRADDWTNLAQKIIQAIYFFNPVVQWICRKLDFEREVACDDWVLTVTGHAKPYARSLTKVLEATPWRRGPVLASGAIFRKQQIIRRIEMLLDGTRDTRPKVSQVTLVVILMCILGAFSQVVRMPAFVAFGDGGSRQHSRWTSDGRTVESDIRGDIEFEEDDITVRSMSTGGSLRIRESRGWSSRELQIRDDSAQPQIRYLVDGRERPLDEQGRHWMATILPMMIREHGIDAERRAGRILQKRGASGLFDEIDRISNGHVRRRYLSAAIGSRTLNGDELRRAMNRAARIDSDHEKAQLLIEVGDLYTSEPLRQSYFDAVNSMNSDHERRRVLSKLLAETRPDPRFVVQAGRSIERIQSDHEKAQVLKEALANVTLDDPEAYRALMRATASINSDHEKANVLISMLKSHTPSGAPLDEFMRVAGNIQSDHEKARVLHTAAERGVNEGGVSPAFIAAAKSINSDHEKANVLSKVDFASADVFIAIRSIQSDDDKRRAIEAVLRRQPSIEVVKSAVDAAATINSDHNKAKVLEIVAERHSNDPEIREALRRALEKIGSDSDYRRIVSKLLAQPAADAPAGQ